MIVRAVLEKLATADGLVSFNSKVTIGTVYFVILESITRGQQMLHMSGGVTTPHQKDIIWTPDGFWLPLECLRLEIGNESTHLPQSARDNYRRHRDN